jgi:23S rRNA (cytosine1962-C5)-methyltransferase
MSINTVVLKKNREKSLLRRHPWVFSGAVATIDGKPKAGDTVEIVSSKGEWLARGAYSPESQITARVWTFDKEEQVDRDFFVRRIKAAAEYRNFLQLDKADCACREIASESDGLPGLIVDRYADYLVVQFLAAGTEYNREIIVDCLNEVFTPAGIYERSDVSVRAKEGLQERVGLLAGSEPPEQIEINENGLKFMIDVRGGHKTGYYLDQRDNRAVVQAVASGKTVLNCFAYTGGFGVAAAVGGAEMITNVDSSVPALELAADNMRLNGIEDDKFENIEADVFSILRKFRAEGRKFDVIVLDPPKFVESQKALPRACRAYKDIAILGFQLLNPGGLLFNFSCSGLMPQDLFQKITADAAVDAGVNTRIVSRLSQAADHPTSLNFPEGYYLKGIQCRID